MWTLRPRPTRAPPAARFPVRSGGDGGAHAILYSKLRYYNVFEAASQINYLARRRRASIHAPGPGPAIRGDDGTPYSSYA